MPVKPKIYGKNAVNILRDAYVSRKMSTTEISKDSEALFGSRVSASTIYKELVRHGIPVRDKSESVQRAVSMIDIDSSYITENHIEWIDGLMLGDGTIEYKKSKPFMGSRIALGSSHEEWTTYGMSGVKVFEPCDAKAWGKMDKKHPNHLWSSRTHTHPDIVAQAKRWYTGENYKKRVPEDVRITSTSLLLWYLGDGSFTYVKDSNIAVLRLHTCDFSNHCINNILIPKLEELGIRCKHEKSKNDIRVCADSIRTFFNIIGHVSPIRCYDHKFNIPEWLKLIRLSGIVKNDKEKWRAQSYYKSCTLECSKSPGGKMLLFTEKQADKLKERLKA